MWLWGLWEPLLRLFVGDLGDEVQVGSKRWKESASKI